MKTRIIASLGIVLCGIAFLTMIKSVQDGKAFSTFDIVVLIVDVVILIACIRQIINSRSKEER